MVSSIGTSDALSQLLSQWNIGSTISTSSTDSPTSSSSTSNSAASVSSTDVTSLSKGDLISAFQQLAQSLQATLLQAQSDSSQASSGSDGQSGGPGGPGGGPDFSQLYAQLTGGSGDLTESEFVSGRPSGMSSDQATTLWNQIDSSGASSLTESQFASSLQSLGPEGASSSATDTSSSSSSSSTTGTGSIAGTEQTVLQDIQSALVSYQAATASLQQAMTAGSGVSVSA